MHAREGVDACAANRQQVDVDRAFVRQRQRFGRFGDGKTACDVKEVTHAKSQCTGCFKKLSARTVKVDGDGGGNTVTVFSRFHREKTVGKVDHVTLDVSAIDCQRQICGRKCQVIDPDQLNAAGGRCQGSPAARRVRL